MVDKLWACRTHLTDEALLSHKMRNERGENIIELVLREITENVLLHEIKLMYTTPSSSNFLLGLIAEVGH